MSRFNLSDMDIAMLLFLFLFIANIFLNQAWVHELVSTSFGIVVGGLSAHLRLRARFKAKQKVLNNQKKKVSIQKSNTI